MLALRLDGILEAENADSDETLLDMFCMRKPPDDASSTPAHSG